MNAKVVVGVVGTVVALVGAGFGIKKLADRRAKRVAAAEQLFDEVGAHVNEAAAAWQREEEDLLAEMKKSGEELDKAMQETEAHIKEITQTIQKRHEDFHKEAEKAQQEMDEGGRDIAEQFERLSKSLDGILDGMDECEPDTCKMDELADKEEK